MPPAAAADQTGGGVQDLVAQGLELGLGEVAVQGRVAQPASDVAAVSDAASHFDEGGYWGHAARAYRDLGELRRAEECAERSVGLCLSGHSRTRAQRNTIQATAHLRMGEIDAAAAAGEQVVREAWNLHSGHVFGEIAELAAEIEPFKTPAASDFLNQARELLTADVVTTRADSCR